MANSHCLTPARLSTGSSRLSLSATVDAIIAASTPAARARRAHHKNLERFLLAHPYLLNKDFTLHAI